ncbi:MAG: glycosyltransferase [Candidatus Shapirobacteria bacterium]
MKIKKKILVLTDDLPWGHRSIARAIFNYLKSQEKENDYNVHYSEVKANVGIAGDLYTFAYRYLPESNRLSHQFFKNKNFRQLCEDMSVLNLPRVKKEIERIKPDLVISSYFFHSHSLAKWRVKENKKFKLWNVVTDPWTINPITFVKEADLHIIYDDVSAIFGHKYGIPDSQMIRTGWWVRPEMYIKYDRQKIREKLGFHDDRPVIFIGGGSLGTNSLTKILPALMLLKKKVGFIINTGTDKFAHKLVDEYIKLYKRIKKDDLVQIKNFGWIDNMGEILAASDMVFGKAGPNFLFDVMATETPFVAITHIGGQEDGNIDLIEKKKLGWVKEKNGEISKFLIEYLNNPKAYESKYMENIKKEALTNQKSLPMILEMIKKI